MWDCQKCSSIELADDYNFCPYCGSASDIMVADNSASDNSQRDAIALAEKYIGPFSPESTIRKVGIGFINWLQE